MSLLVCVFCDELLCRHGFPCIVYTMKQSEPTDMPLHMHRTHLITKVELQDYRCSQCSKGTWFCNPVPCKVESVSFLFELTLLFLSIQILFLLGFVQEREGPDW